MGGDARPLVLLTGAAGKVGTALAAALQATTESWARVARAAAPPFR